MASYGPDNEGIRSFLKTVDKESHILPEAGITSFAFARLVTPRVKQLLIADTHELKEVSLYSGSNRVKKTGRVDAEKMSRIIRMQVLSGEKAVNPVTVPPELISELRGLFTTCRLYRKQNTQVKNRVHSLMKERLYGYTREEIFGVHMRQNIRGLEAGTVLNFQVNQLLDRLERGEQDVEKLKERILLQAAPLMKQIEILCSMYGISVFIAIAIMADIIDVSRFRNAKAFASYLRPVPKVESSNTHTANKATSRKGRKLSSPLLTRSLIHILKAGGKLQRWYERLCGYKKKGLVRTALRRRVLTEIYQMLKKGEYHYARDGKNHRQKMEAYEKFLRENNVSFEKNLAESA
jgi:transposase